MKKIFGIIAVVLLAIPANGQKSIDDLFAKYDGKDGFVSVSINGSLLKLVADLDKEADDNIPGNMSMIRILAQDDENLTGPVQNFWEMVKRDLDMSEYEEFMTVKESKQDVRMLVKTDGKMFSEFLLIVGGKDNAIIQIKGRMTLDEAKKFADGAKKDNVSGVLLNK